MRKIGITFVLIMIMLSACQKRATFSLSQSEASVDRIEIIAVDPQRIYSHDDTSTFQIQQIIAPNQHSMFLKELYDVPCYRYRNDPIQGFNQDTIRVIYLDGSYELIGWRTVYYETPAGDWKYPPYYFEGEAFEEFIAEQREKWGQEDGSSIS